MYTFRKKMIRHHQSHLRYHRYEFFWNLQCEHGKDHKAENGEGHHLRLINIIIIIIRAGDYWTSLVIIIHNNPWDDDYYDDGILTSASCLTECRRAFMIVFKPG